MVYTELTVRAMQIAYQAHHGQVDKGGVPYVLHPVHLAEQMSDETAACAALLHDVVEDTDWTLEQLAAEFPEEVIRALALLTHAEDVPYMEYVERIAADPVARQVKIADLRHNLESGRLCMASEDVRRRACEKGRLYREALDYLVGE